MGEKRLKVSIHQEARRLETIFRPPMFEAARGGLGNKCLQVYALAVFRWPFFTAGFQDFKKNKKYYRSNGVEHERVQKNITAPKRQIDRMAGYASRASSAIMRVQGRDASFNGALRPFCCGTLTPLRGGIRFWRQRNSQAGRSQIPDFADLVSASGNQSRTVRGFLCERRQGAVEVNRVVVAICTGTSRS